MLEQVKSAPDAGAILSEVCKIAEAWGSPSVVFPWGIRGEQTKRLLIDMLILAEGDSDLGQLLGVYRQANRIECRGHSYTDDDADTLDNLGDELSYLAKELHQRFTNAASYIRQEDDA